MKHLLLLVSALMVAAVPNLARAEDAAPPGFDPARHMRISEVKDGMKGYGLSVFRGTTIERFDVEVISVLKNFNPQHHVIWVRCMGANLEHTGAIAGMSGSPIFLRDEQGRERMVGAFAYGFPLAKDPVGGVQPIEYMLEMAASMKKPPTTQPLASRATNDRAGSGDASGRATWSLFDLLPRPGQQKNGKPSPERGDGSGLSSLAEDDNRIQPLATPLMVSGMPQRLMSQFEPALRARGIVPLQAGGVSGGAGPANASARLEPGAAIAVPMMSGDMDMTAIGTVTEVVGDRVLAFGHSFFSEGDVALPMGSGYIHTVIATLNKSFKLGSLTGVQGTLQSDQLVGIGGRLGNSPDTIPIEIRCAYADGSFDQTYHFNAALHPKLTPMLATMAASTAVSGLRELPQYHTLDYDITLEYANGQVVRVQNRSVNHSSDDLVSAIGQPLIVAMENPFERVPVRRIRGDIRVSDAPRQAEILSVSLPRTRHRPGDTLRAFITYRPFRGPEAILPVEFELPRDLPDGAYDFAVMDWQRHLAEEAAMRPFRFTAQSTKDVFDVLRDYTAVRQDAVYLRLLRTADGVAVGRTAMSKLPGSRRQVLLGAGLSNTAAFVSATSRVVSTDFVMNGQARFTVTIDKDAPVDTAAQPSRRPDAAPAPQQSAAKPREDA